MNKSSFRSLNLAAACLAVLFLGACASNTTHDRIELENSRIWTFHKVGAADTSTLYGTMHAQDERVFVDEAILRERIPLHDLLAIEIHPDSIGNPELAALVQMQEATLSQLLNEDDLRKLDSLLTGSFGSGVAAFESTQPVFVSTLLTAGFMSADREITLDQYIAELGREAGLELHGLETPTEQIKAITRMSLDDQTEMLSATINNLEEHRELSDVMVDAFARHDMRKLDSVITISTSDTEAGKEMYAQLFQQRNKVMLARIEELLPRGRLFVAVGAGHLSGRGGLIDLLRRNGFRVSAVMPN